MSYISPRPTPESLNDLDIDELVERLTPGEIQTFLDEADPDDPQIPPSLRCNYKCEKPSTGAFDKKALLDFIQEQALNEPDIPDIVPHVPGTIRGKKWSAPVKPRQPRLEDEIELGIDLGEDVELALSSATTDEIVDLAGIMGLHSMMNQDQYHASHPEPDKHKVLCIPKPDVNIGWNGVTKATPLKVFPDEKPNKTVPEEVVEKVLRNDPSIKQVNLNNIPVQENLFLELFDALEHNTHLVELSVANTMMTDTAASILSSALETNKTLQHLNIESNNVSPQTLVSIFEAINVHQTLQTIKASNQQAKFLGNKCEVAITKAIENNKSIMKVGLHLQFGDCRNRVDVQLQKNLDRLRLKRVAHKLSSGQGGFSQKNGDENTDSDGNYSGEE